MRGIAVALVAGAGAGTGSWREEAEAAAEAPRMTTPTTTRAATARASSGLRVGSVAPTVAAGCVSALAAAEAGLDQGVRKRLLVWGPLMERQARLRVGESSIAN